MCGSYSGEEGDQMSLFCVSWNSCEGHFIAWNMLAWVGDVGVEMLFGPAYSCSLHRLAIAKGSGSSLAVKNTAEGRSSCALAVALSGKKVTSRAWQTLHWSS